jgi:thiol-disulfide isomerase/thioredoxin
MYKRLILGIALIATSICSARDDQALKLLVGTKVGEVGFELADGTKKTMEDYKGKWVLLEFGGTWCMPSEDLITTYSSIRRQLEGQPFEYIHAYDDPDWTTIDLNTFVTLHGVGGRLTKDIPEKYQLGFIPVCILVDPTGTIVWSDGMNFEPEIRKALADKLSPTLKLPTDFLTVSEYRKAQQIAGGLIMRGRYPEARSIYEKLIEVQPHELWNYKWLAFCLEYDGSKTEAANLINSKVSELEKHDPKLPMTLYRLQFQQNWRCDKNSYLKPILERLIQAYPTHREFKMYKASIANDPSAISDEDLKHVSYYTNRDIRALYTLGNTLRTKRQFEAAEQVHEELAQKLKTKLPLASFYLEQNYNKGKQFIEETFSTTDIKNANDQTLVAAAISYSMIQNWSKSKTFADEGLRKNSINVDLHALRSLANHFLGQKNDAKANMEEFLKLKSEDHSIQYVQGIISGKEKLSSEAAVRYEGLNLCSSLFALAVDSEIKGEINKAEEAWKVLFENATLGTKHFFVYTPLYAAFKARQTK